MFNFLSKFAPFESLFNFLSQFGFWQNLIQFISDNYKVKKGLLLQIAKSTDDTLYVLLLSGFFAFCIGLPLGVILFTTRKNQILESKWVHNILSFLVNVFRAIPFIILIYWAIPFTSFIMKTLTGQAKFTSIEASMIPLCIGAAPLIARMIENALLDIPKGLIEASRSMGANPLQIITKVLIPESLPVIINSVTIALITLMGYVAIIGTLGIKVLGQLADQYGYKTYNPFIMNTVVIIMILLVFSIQKIGDFTVKKISHK